MTLAVVEDRRSRRCWRNGLRLRIGCAVLTLILPTFGPARAATPQPAEKGGRPISIEAPPDAAIQRRIEGILAALGGMEALQVDVRAGVAHLGGRADSPALREQAAEIAARVDGVVLVKNDVEVTTSVRDRLAPTWAKVKGYFARLLGYLPLLAVALTALAGFLLLSWALGRWERLFPRLGLSHLGASLLRVALRTVLIVAGLVVALDILGLIAFVGTVVGALGLVGVVAGIAFRDVVANYLPGIILGMNPPFRPRDRVQIGEHEGRVVRVTSRETVLVDNDGQHLRIPNQRLLQEPIVNFERHRERRLDLRFELALSADLRQVRDVGRETLLGERGVLPEPAPFMRVLKIEAALVRIAYHAWADQRETNFLELESRARQAVKEALLTANVPFPVPEIAVHQRGVGAPVTSLDEEGADGREEALLRSHLRDELAAKHERDLLTEGRRSST